MASSFYFLGKIPASKSLFNRALVAASHSQHSFTIQGEADSDDVALMRQGLLDMKNFSPIQCGHAGTVLRFMALRASRVRGEHVLIGSERLFSRPQKEILRLMGQLGVEAEIKSDRLILKSKGWRYLGDALHVPSDRSSQFASAVLLNSWQLSYSLFLSVGRSMPSEAYWLMTLKLMQQLGMKVEGANGEYCVAKDQQVMVDHYEVEMDMSSAFAIAAVAAVSGEAIIENMPLSSSQPDSIFPEILKTMGVPIEIKGNRLKVTQAEKLKNIDLDLRNCPDLFPVLAVLCALAEGKSRLYGAEHLIYKESNRIEKVAELVQHLGRKVDFLSGGLLIGGNLPKRPPQEFNYDTDQDHRLAMAGAVALKAQFPIHILRPEVISKSYRRFWQSLGVEVL